MTETCGEECLEKNNFKRHKLIRQGLDGTWEPSAVFQQAFNKSLERRKKMSTHLGQTECLWTALMAGTVQRIE
jgi:hypothetical protein